MTDKRRYLDEDGLAEYHELREKARSGFGYDRRMQNSSSALEVEECTENVGTGFVHFTYKAYIHELPEDGLDRNCFEISSFSGTCSNAPSGGYPTFIPSRRYSSNVSPQVMIQACARAPFDYMSKGYEWLDNKVWEIGSVCVMHDAGQYSKPEWVSPSIPLHAAFHDGYVFFCIGGIGIFSGYALCVGNNGNYSMVIQKPVVDSVIIKTVGMNSFINPYNYVLDMSYFWDISEAAS